jgi:hypothetical protein
VLDRDSIAHVATSADLLADSESRCEKEGSIRDLGIPRQLEEPHRRFGVTRPVALERHRSVTPHS